MGKYEPISTYLRRLPDSRDVITLTFSQMQDILSQALPTSARRYLRWWANDRAHVQARAWLEAGWKTQSPDLRSGKVTFIREGQAGRRFTRQKPNVLGQPEYGEAKVFERMAREIMARHFHSELQPSKVSGIPKTFDMVSSNEDIVGDAKWLTLVQGKKIPSAKFSVIAEYVWLLEKVSAKHKFLVFGNDERVPIEWLKRYGDLVTGISFFFIGKTGTLQTLK